MASMGWRWRGWVGLPTAVGVAACAGLGGEPERAGAPDYPPGDPVTPNLACSLAPAVGACAPPQVLIVLDRSVSMAARPDGTLPPDTATALVESKWSQAIAAIEGVVGSDAGARVSFGLELFPRDPGEGDCSRLDEIFTGHPQWYPLCRDGALLVPPCSGASAEVVGTVDPETTTLCGDTPIGGALTVAADTLAAMRKAEQRQFVLLVTDGGETCSWKVSALETVWNLRRAGVGTFVVGFGGEGVDAVGLSDLACAGGVALAEDSGCMTDADGNATWDEAAPTTFLVASDGPALAAVMQDIAAQIGCVVVR